MADEKVKEPFNPNEWMIRVNGGKKYLPVAARLVWFREEKPDWGIVTTPLDINMERQYCIFQAQVFDSNGKVIATGTKVETAKGFPDYVEKAETGAVGRALAMVGYGTQFAPELEEGDRLADAPQGSRGDSGGSNGQSNGYRNGNGAGAAHGDGEQPVCHCGRNVTAARATMCEKKGIPPCCPGACEQMVGASR
jgi:hypothetical protein